MRASDLAVAAALFVKATVPLVLLLVACTRSSEIVIRNDSDSDVWQVMVSYEGGSFQIERLRKGESVRRRIVPAHEGDLKISLIGTWGQRGNGAYIDPGYGMRYDVTFRIGPQGSIQVENLPEVRFFWW